MDLQRAPCMSAADVRVAFAVYSPQFKALSVESGSAAPCCVR